MEETTAVDDTKETQEKKNFRRVVNDANYYKELKSGEDWKCPLDLATRRSLVILTGVNSRVKRSEIKRLWVEERMRGEQMESVEYRQLKKIWQWR